MTARRHDPGRRDRIIDAALDVIAEHGVAGTTHRKVAAAADVPLGSMTYHFTGLEDLLTAAFSRLAEQVSTRFNERLARAGSQEQAREAVVDEIIGEPEVLPRNLLLSYELYAFASRHPALRAVMRDWMRRSRRALEQHFDPDTSRALDALIEGLMIHRSVDPAPASRAEIRTMVDRVAPVGGKARA
jgi:TetR/AcrR family transcriptional regulator, regulator of biofilm formation and stress response